MTELEQRVAARLRQRLLLGLAGVLGTLVMLVVVCSLVSFTLILIGIAFARWPPWPVLAAASAAVVGLLFFEHRRGRATRLTDLPGPEVSRVLAELAYIPEPMGVSYLLFGLPRTFWWTADRLRAARKPDARRLGEALQVVEALDVRPNRRLALAELRAQLGATIDVDTALVLLAGQLGWIYLASSPNGPRVVLTLDP